MNVELLDALMALMSELGINELCHDQDGIRVHLQRTPATHGGINAPSMVAEHAMPPPAGTPATMPPDDEMLLAPMSGTFYLTPAPDAPPFVRIGDVVEEGAPLYVLEVMKTLNRICADFRCRIKGIEATTGQPVTAGAPLFSVERLDDHDV
ncbi:biotin/lipoyl-containing protein [Komagataeibacter sp. FNDCF1]|uniref:acetyl-CoA carboxylase biotin carboxyl carrier protein n=1 Tax=Komagataeibacter sp. FNDCF1 TaxID=2878681 RepID=UPI001E4C9348|nr:biotin/lipoyl-containing protein [Komagataeibacter sp. FNDCF1]MCE2563300.1 acetyl-CoA carboxylase biotin carboxyl carrier protein subunit [Komagataeibacter sp. FNDCF1]